MKFCRASTVFNMSEYNPDVLAPVVAAHFATGCTAVLFNLLIVWSVSKTHSIQTPSRVLLCSLSLTDLCLGLIAQPATAFFYISAFQKWEEGFCFCHLLMTRAGYTLGVIAFFSLTVMSVDRCLAVKTLDKYKHLVTKRRAIGVGVGVWTIGAACTLLSLELYGTKQLTIAVFIGAVVIAIMVISFLIAYKSLKKITNRISNSSNPTDFNVSKYRHSLATMVLILGLNLVVYLPTVLFIIVGHICVIRRNHSLVFFQYNGVILAMNSTMNPLFYIWRMKDLRNSVRRQLSI